jgi:hypothetical protein
MTRKRAGCRRCCSARDECSRRDFKINQKDRCTMKQITLTIPELGLIVGTRAAAGAGLALLLADRLNPDQRRAVGWTLLAVGIATTIPLVAQIFGKRQETLGTDRT